MQSTETGIVIPHPAFIKARKGNSGNGSAGRLDKPENLTPPKSAKAKKSKRLPKLQADRHFWPHVDTSAGPEACHPWIGTIDHGNGYGRLWGIEGIPYAHRMAWQLARGVRPPKGFHVTHSCNNKRCCNSIHLELKRPKGNSEDAVRDGLLRKKRLTPDQVAEIVALRFKRAQTYTEIAARYSVCNRTIADICRGRTHSKITGIVRVKGSRKVSFRLSASVPAQGAAEHRAG